MNKQLSILIWASVVSLCVGCVSTKKYTQLQQKHNLLLQKQNRDSVQAAQQEARLIIQRDSLIQVYDHLTNLYLELKNDSVTLGRNYQRNKRLLDDLFEKYEQLDKAYRQVSGSLGSETALLAQGLSQKEKDLLTLEQKLLAQQAHDQKQAMQLQEREAAIEAIETKRQKQEKLLNDWKKQLLKTSPTGSDTAFRFVSSPTRLSVRLPETQLIDTTSAQLTSVGRNLFKTIGVLLKNQPDVHLTILHTDKQLSSPLSEAKTASLKKITTIIDFLKKEGVTLQRINSLTSYLQQGNIQSGSVSLSKSTGFFEIILGLKEEVNALYLPGK